MASTTKIMTALIVVRLMAKDPGVGDELVTFSRRADRTIGSTSGVREGERLPVRELLYGLLLPSGNDASVAFAEHFGGRLKPPDDAPKTDDPLPRFIAEMNRVADELGLHETHFDNPNGLPAPGHRSSAATWPSSPATRWPSPTFAAVVSTRKHGCTLVDAQGKRRNVVWTNTNHLLDTEGYDGVKTGHDPGGRHLPGGQRPSRPGPPDRRRPGRLQLAGQPVPRRPQPLPVGLADARRPVGQGG